MMTVVTDHLWLMRMSVGPTREERRRFFGGQILVRLAELLPGTSVGLKRDGNVLTHPERDEIEASRVGVVVRAWFDRRRGELFSTLAIADARIERRLAAIERRRLLHTLGISMILDGAVYDDVGADTIALRDVAGVASLDFVSYPAAHAHVLRSVPLPEGVTL
jgi:hypothetical protein